MDEQIYLLIAKSLNNELTGDERRELDVWLNADAANKTVYEEMEKLWQETDTLLQQPSFDTEAAWDAVAKRTIAVLPAVPERKLISFPNWLKFSAAAAVLMASFIGYRLLNTNHELTVIAAADGQVVKLPDQSVVTLKKGSTLKYPEIFDAHERHLSLDGDAFFEVARNEEQPFIVDARAVAVQVLGTSFNVSCDDSSAHVVVATGKVQVTVAKDHSRKSILLPGMGVDCKHDLLVESTDTNVIYYRTGRLKFSELPLVDVIREIGKVKNTTITIDPALPQDIQLQLVTKTFTGDLETMLNELTLITKGIRWIKKDRYYLITTK